MPFIHIKSLPFEKPINTSNILETLAKDFSRKNRIGLEYITATWEFLPKRHSVVAGKSAEYQDRDSHLIIIDLLTPDFNTTKEIETMLKSIASSLSQCANIPINNIFINYRQSHSGMVFDSGKIVHWK